MRRNHFGGQLSVKLNFLGAGGAGVVSTIAIDAAFASWKMMWRRRRGGKVTDSSLDFLVIVNQLNATSLVSPALQSGSFRLLLVASREMRASRRVMRMALECPSSAANVRGVSHP